MPDAGRVIAGLAGGRRLLAPGDGTRPLGDRVKQALFGALEADPAAPLAGPFLDLFAGSGAAGIEALSRGAPAAVFVEHDAGAVQVIADNLRRTGLEGGRPMRIDARRYLEGDVPAGGGPFQAALVDPPYADAGLLLDALGWLGDTTAGWLRPSAVVVAKHPWRWEPPATLGVLTRDRGRRFGETTLTWYRRLAT